jgi:tetratricopeptide (TPR) repeat protein
VRSILIAPFLVLAFFSPAAAQDDSPVRQASESPELTTAQREARQELNEAASSYHDGNFVAAQQHSEKALSLDPSSKTALLFVARTIHAQYKPGDQTEANVAKAREGIDAYKRILTQDRQSEEAYKAIAYLFGSLKENELQRQWVFQRAVDPNYSNEKRAEAFVVLASRDWDCSFKITELPTNHTTTLLKNGSAKIHYSRPKDAAGFEKAKRCAADGLAMIENAITLWPDNDSAWSYKTNLLQELSKLAEMDNNLSLKVDYESQVEAAGRMTEYLNKAHTNIASPKP